MVNLRHRNIFLTFLLVITECHLAMSREKDYTICNENSPHLSSFNEGSININHNKLEMFRKCTLTLELCEQCVINFSLLGEDVNRTCTKKTECPCHFSSYSLGIHFNENLCYKRRCPFIKISASPANDMVLIPSYQNNCKVSTKSSRIYIDACQSQTNFTGVKMMYDVYAANTKHHWIFERKYLNFTMCMGNGDRTLNLGTQGFIHMSNCSGKCVLHLNSCSRCKIQFYMDISNLSGRNHLCLTIKISDKYKKEKYRFSAKYANYLNYTTFSKAAILEICQSDIEALQLKIFYRVIEKVETKIISPPNVAHLQFPSSYSTNNEVFKYHIKKFSNSGILQLIFTSYLRCAYCYVTIETGISTFNISKDYMHRLYISRDTIILKYFTGNINFGSLGFNAEIRYFEDSNLITPNTFCGKYQTVVTSGHLRFFNIYSIYYDCVWILKSDSIQKYFSLSVKASLSNRSHVDIHDGNTSWAPKLASLKNSENYYGIKFHTAYIRLQGLVMNLNKVDIIYTITGSQCPTNTFRCMNYVCIPKYKRCNNHVDCSDKSDEDNCPSVDEPGKSYTTYWSYSLIIIIVVTTFIILSLCIFFIFVCKIRRIRQTFRRNSSAISSVSANHNHIRMNLTFEGGLDAPPAYDEVMSPSTLQGNINLAFNWSHTTNNCSEGEATGMPPTYQEYMQQISSTDNDNSRENNDETSGNNTAQQILTGSASEQEDILQRESSNGKKDQTVPADLTTEMNSLGTSSEIFQPVLDVNSNPNTEVVNDSNDNLCSVQGAECKEIAVEQHITNTENCRLPENQEAANIRERKIKESNDGESDKNQRDSIVFLSEQLSHLDNEVYI